VKYSEEQQKRARAEERLRVVKDYAEQARARVSELDSHCQSLETRNTELTQKLQRTRKASQESGKSPSQPSPL